jgi:hypothetical protein
MINVVKFQTQTGAQNFIDFVHNCLKGSELGWQGLDGYSAEKWSDVDSIKGYGVEEWAISVQSPQLVKYRELYPEIDQKVKDMFSGIQIEQVEDDYWTDPNGGIIE